MAHLIFRFLLYMNLYAIVYMGWGQIQLNDSSLSLTPGIKVISKRLFKTEETFEI